MIVRDFAKFYGVETKGLNKAVKRILNRFSEVFSSVSELI